jgi:Fe-S-cluster containining protein
LKERTTEDPPEIDLSELEGQSYRCVDDCALCCLCQPELLPDEERRFRSNPALMPGVTDEHISPDVKGAAIRLKGRHGACHFLTDKRCTIYGQRPHFCRSFPLNVFVGWRVQVNVNRSCRGLGLPGEELEPLGSRLLSEYGHDRLISEVRSANEVFSQFVRNARDASVAQSFSSVRNAAALLDDELTEQFGLSRVMTYAEYGSTRPNSSPADMAKRVRLTEAEANISERALMDGVELFDLPDLSLLPVYVGPDLFWKMFKLDRKTIVGWELGESGETKEFCRVDPSSVDLLPMTSGGRESVREYLHLMNSRDCFLGHAAYLCDMEAYEFNFGQVYLGAVANNIIDLWWRASLLAQVNGVEQLDVAEIREGVVFFDMDLLDLPTIGAFI